jgi:hypothetical protein
MNSPFLIQATKLERAVPGIVYVLVNEAMPGIVKIGMTTGDLIARIKQLDTTGVPLPFECVLAVQVHDVYFVESRIHQAFADRRVRASREFFRVSTEPVKAVLELVAGANVTPKQDIVESDADQLALDAAKKRRSNFRFSMVGIKPGTVLTSAFDESVTCTVHDERYIVFRDHVRSLSDAALEVAHEKGFLWKAVQGPRAWKFGDALLDDLRNELAGADDGGESGLA